MPDLFKYIEYFYSINEVYIVYMFSFLIFIIVSIVIFFFVKNFLSVREIKKRAYNPSMAGGGAAILDLRLPRNAGISAVSAVLSKTASRFARGNENKSSLVIRRDLIQAGFHDPSALAWYYFSRVVLSVTLPVIGFPILVATDFAKTTLITTAVLIMLALIGLIIPSLYLMRRKSKLSAEFRDGFPEFMDLLVVCGEAGIGLSASIDRVTKEITKTHQNLGVNLHVMNLELRAGASITEAFDSLAGRVTIDEVRSLGSLMQQSEQLGTSLTDALRTYSKEMREKRFFRAEEKAYALPAKMVIPLGLFIFPVMLTVIMLPLVIRIKAGFGI